MPTSITSPGGGSPDLADLAARYRRDGYVGGVRVLSSGEAAGHRRRLEAAESRIGPLHYRAKAHTILVSAWELATHPRLLDAVEACIGPDILVYDATYIVKEPGTTAKVNWHQDLTYWGLADDDAQVTAWLALSPATVEAGCMRMVPGSHLAGRIDHIAPERRGDDDVLDLGQFIDGVDETRAVAVPLAPGEASLHHGWTVHASAPNTSDDRRIGLNVQFVTPRNRQLMHDRDTAVLVRGEDRFGHFGTDRPAVTDLDPVAVGLQDEAHRRVKANYTAVRDR